MTLLASTIPAATSTSFRTVQIWAVWHDDFDKRVQVEVKDWDRPIVCGVESHASTQARRRGAIILGCNPAECEARYVVTRTMRDRG